MSQTDQAKPAPAEDSSSASMSYGKTAGFLAIGVGLTGVITYLFFFIASHNLSKDDYGEITILWSAVFITVSTLYRPVDQLLSRHISEHVERGESDSAPVKVAAKIQVCLALLFAVLALALKGPLENDLLAGNSTLYWVFFSSVLFYAASYYARGYLAGHQQFGLFTALILSESIFRTLFAVLVAVGILSGQSLVAMGIVAAPLLSLMVVPFAFARKSRREPERKAPRPAPEGEEAEEFSLAHGAGFAGSVLLVMFSEQVFLNAGPLVVRGIEGVAAAGFIFNMLMIARAPLQLFQAVSTSLLPHLTSLHSSTEPGSDSQFHRSVRMVLLGLAGFTALVIVAILIAGPQLMELAFSGKFTYDRPGMVLIALGMGLYLSAVTVNQACLAQGQARRVSWRWLGCAIFFVAWTLVPLIEDGNRRVEIGFTLTAGILFTLLYLIYLRPRGREEDVPKAGSAEEMEARMASLEEGTP